jgi:hypothetical protein
MGGAADPVLNAQHAFLVDVLALHGARSATLYSVDACQAAGQECHDPHTLLLWQACTAQPSDSSCGEQGAACMCITCRRAGVTITCSW